MVPLYDVFRAVTLVVAFTVGLQDRKTSMLADMVFTGCFGAVSYLCPQTILGLQTTEKLAGDPVLMFICRVVGAHFLGLVLMWYFCRKSRDDCVIGALLWSRVLGFLPLLMVMVYGHFTYSKSFVDRHLYFMMTFMTCVWLSSLVQLLKTRPAVGRRDQKGLLSTICRINFFFAFLVGLSFMAFPKMIMGFMDLKPVHLHFVRVVGALIFSMTFLAWYSPSFRDNEHRKIFFYCELLAIGLTIVALLYSHFGPPSILDRKQVMCMIMGTFPGLLPISGLIHMRQSDVTVRNTSYFTRSKTA